MRGLGEVEVCFPELTVAFSHSSLHTNHCRIVAGGQLMPTLLAVRRDGSRRQVRNLICSDLHAAQAYTHSTVHNIEYVRVRYTGVPNYGTRTGADGARDTLISQSTVAGATNDAARASHESADRPPRTKSDDV